jgi:ribosomal protein S30
MGPTTADVYGPAAGQVYQGANQGIQEAATQALQNQRQMQAMELRFDVRKRTPKVMQAKERQANRPLPRNQVLSFEGKVLWPNKAPNEGELGKSRTAAEQAIQTAYKEFKAGGKASVQNVVEAKERLYSYGHPAIDKAADQSRQAAQGLHHFLYSLEKAIDSLGGV